MFEFFLVLIYSALIVAACLFGGWLPTHFELSHVRMQFIISFVGGLMLGIALLHLIPHGIHHAHSIDLVLGSTLVGLLAMFLLIRIFNFHQHGPTAGAHGDEHHGHGCEHDHVHVAQSGSVGWTGVAFGLGVHTLIDGIALGAAMRADHGSDTMLLGLGVFLAIFLHKPLDALSITTLMIAGGWPPRTRQWVNVSFALMCPLGALLVLTGMDKTAYPPGFLGGALGFSAGVFLCISLSDLLPEVQFHHHDRVKLSTALLLGVGLAWGIHFLEPSHSHSLPAAPSVTTAPAGSADGGD